MIFWEKDEAGGAKDRLVATSGKIVIGRVVWSYETSKFKLHSRLFYDYPGEHYQDQADAQRALEDAFRRWLHAACLSEMDRPHAETDRPI